MALLLESVSSNLPFKRNEAKQSYCVKALFVCSRFLRFPNAHGFLY